MKKNSFRKAVHVFFTALMLGTLALPFAFATGETTTEVETALTFFQKYSEFASGKTWYYIAIAIVAVLGVVFLIGYVRNNKKKSGIQNENTEI